MSGPACQIIINCGALKSIFMEGATFEGELCDNAEILTEYLTPAEKESVFQRGQEAHKFGGIVQKYLDDERDFFRKLVAAHKNDG